LNDVISGAGHNLVTALVHQQSDERREDMAAVVATQPFPIHFRGQIRARNLLRVAGRSTTRSLLVEFDDERAAGWLHQVGIQMGA